MTMDTDVQPHPSLRRARGQVVATSFASLFSIVGIALYGLPLFHDCMVRDFGWSQAQVTSGNALRGQEISLYRLPPPSLAGMLGVVIPSAGSGRRICGQWKTASGMARRCLIETSPTFDTTEGGR